MSENCRGCGRDLTDYEIEMERTLCEECRDDAPMHGTGYGDNVNGGLNR